MGDLTLPGRAPSGAAPAPAEPAAAAALEKGDTQERPKEEAGRTRVDPPEEEEEEAGAVAAVAPEHSSSSFTINRNIEQIVHVCVPHKKPRLLLRFILRIRETEKAERVRNPGPMIIFCSKIKTLNFVVAFLERHGVTAQKMHGQLDQKLREKTLAEFKAVSGFVFLFIFVILLTLFDYYSLLVASLTGENINAVRH